MRYLLLLFVLLGGPAHAAQTQTRQEAVNECISNIDAHGDWHRCRTLIFEPCQDYTVGEDQHISCLQAQKTQWHEHLEGLIEELNARLTTVGAASLSDSLGQWYEYRSIRCRTAAEERAAIGYDAEAAGIGCEIAETAGLVSDLQNCLDGHSTSAYCALKE